MIKQAHLKKYTPAAIRHLAANQTNTQQLTLFAEALQQKNHNLKAKEAQLVTRLEAVRRKNKLSIHQLNIGIQQSLDRAYNVVYDQQNKPAASDLADLAHLYSKQKQSSIIQKNNCIISTLVSQASAYQNAKNNQFLDANELKNLDNEFEELKKECEREEKVRDELIKQQELQKKHHQGILDSIEQCRKTYEKIQEEIAEQQRRFMHLTSYLECRKEEEKEKAIQLNAETAFLSNQLRKAQELINYETEKLESLNIKQNQ